MTTLSKTGMANLKKPLPKSKKLSKKTPLKEIRLDVFEKRILDFAKKESLWDENASLLLAISGGPDSVCLFFVMLAIAKKQNLTLSVAHLNHNLRKKDSLKDALFVENLAKIHNIPFYKKTLPQKTSSTEEALRKLRYAFFKKLTIEHSFDRVILGHHADDQVETFLLRLLRGSGPDGLKSMSPKNGFYIRPLLSTWKTDILTYLKKHKIPYQIDSTNLENYYQRNKVRNLLIPYLEKNYQPQIKAILLQTVQLLQEHASPQIFTPSIGIIQENPHSLSFSLETFFSLSDQEQSLFFRRILQRFLPQPISRRLYLEIIKMLTSTKNKTQTMTFHGLKLSKKGATVTLQKIFSD